MLKVNDHFRKDDSICRVVAEDKGRFLVLNCSSLAMPRWEEKESLLSVETLETKEALDLLNIPVMDETDMSPEQIKTAHERYTAISGILCFLNDDRLRGRAIIAAARCSGKSRRTITNYLCRYLSSGRLSSLADTEKKRADELTVDQKNMRWALNKFYYTRHGNTIADTYVMMLKEKYTDDKGTLAKNYPSIYQFRYFFNKTRSKQKEIISRKGIKEYQLNYRPLLGDGVQEFAPAVGTFALDATICDLYLTDESGKIIGRPILAAAVDMHSSFCCGYTLLWEGGVYGCRQLLENIK